MPKDTKHYNDAMNNDIVDTPAKVPDSLTAFEQLGVRNDMIYIEADAYSANPYALLGTVLEVHKNGENCPAGGDIGQGTLKISKFKARGANVDESSKLKEPRKRSSLIVDAKLSASVNFLNYLSGQFEGETSFSIMVFDQSTGLLNRDEQAYDDAVDTWVSRNTAVMQDDNICYVYLVIGFVEKYVLRRKYTKFSAGAKGGAFGVSIDGQLYQSNEDFSLDIRYGLQVVSLKSPAPVARKAAFQADETPAEEALMLQRLSEGLVFKDPEKGA